MDILEQYRGRYINAGLIIEWGGAVLVTIADVGVQEFTNNGRQESKPILAFEECDQKWPLNQENALRLAVSMGRDSDGWIGRQLILRTEPGIYQGRPVNKVVATPYPEPQAAAPPRGQQARPAPAPHAVVPARNLDMVYPPTPRRVPGPPTVSGQPFDEFAGVEP